MTASSDLDDVDIVSDEARRIDDQGLNESVDVRETVVVVVVSDGLVVVAVGVVVANVNVKGQTTNPNRLLAGDASRGRPFPLSVTSPSVSVLILVTSHTYSCQLRFKHRNTSYNKNNL